jgi:hypothetical protein
MYLINKTANRISKIEAKTFSTLGFKEREHLQEWIANNPESLGEEILIIQKEFDGFDDTRERLDLLGLDKQGNIVVIENKLDDTGRDVTWQALKYASYCSTLKKEQIKKIYQDYLDKQRVGEKAEDNLIDFFNTSDFTEISLNSGQSQRIIMVAYNFRKEVTSTVLWLMNYKLRIQCFKATLFQLGDQLFLNLEQIIPVRDAGDYTISIADKTQDDASSQEELKARHHIRLQFWEAFFNELNKHNNSFQNCIPSISNSIGVGSGISGVTFTFVISNHYARVECYISRSNRDENKFIFDELLSKKGEIESTFGSALQWERLDNKKACRIKYELNDVDYFNTEDWPKMREFMIDGMQRLEKSLRDQIMKVKTKLKTRGAEA